MYVSHLAFASFDQKKCSSLQTLICLIQSMCMLGKERDAPNHFTWEKAFRVIEDLQIFELFAFEFQDKSPKFLPFDNTVRKPNRKYSL